MSDRYASEFLSSRILIVFKKHSLHKHLKYYLQKVKKALDLLLILQITNIKKALPLIFPDFEEVALFLYLLFKVSANHRFSNDVQYLINLLFLKATKISEYLKRINSDLLLIQNMVYLIVAPKQLYIIT